MDEIDRWEQRKLREWKRRKLLTNDKTLRSKIKIKRLSPKRLKASNPDLDDKEITELYAMLYGELPRGRS